MMLSRTKLLEGMRSLRERGYASLASARGLLLLCLIGLLSGVVVGCIIVLFRALIESAQIALLPGGDPENFEALGWQERLLFLAAGSIASGILFHWFSRPPPRVGVLHVMERLAYHEGHLPLRNAVLQFIGAAVSIISGQSVGREGPSIHLGAAGASLLGQCLRLPNNSIRILVACGTAAAIAASFNTPLAGVIFAMEVVVMEYTINGFSPVILAAVSATTVTRIVFDAEPVFRVPSLDLASYWELPAILVMGIAIGALAALFIVAVRRLTAVGLKLPVWLRMPVGGMGVWVCALAAPAVMGVGYDTVNEVLMGNIALGALGVILLAKLAATVISTGMSLPAGFIGPVLFLGAVAGGIVGMLMGLLPGNASPPALYAMLGMGAMMGATLQAPLAALLALVELTANQHIIFPGMLAVISASLATREVFGQQSIFMSLLQGIGLDYRNDPVAQSLRRLAVGSVMNRRFCIIPVQLERRDAERILAEQQPQWLIIDREQGNMLMPASDLARCLEGAGAAGSSEKPIALMEIPAKRLQLAPIRQQATLQQAHDMLHDPQSSAEALYVVRTIGPMAERIEGVITASIIEESNLARSDNRYFA